MGDTENHIPLDADTRAAWEKHCDRVRAWVAVGVLTRGDGERLCNPRVRAAWARMYLEERDRP